MKRLHLIISGRVQGVGFRYFCYDQAERLGLTGYARNIPDGSVEVEVQGNDEALAKFKTAIERGPRAAKVSDIQNDDKDPIAGERGFGVG